MKQIKKLQARGLYESDKDDPFDLFISSTNIRWCYYKETHKVLGSAYGMLRCSRISRHGRRIFCAERSKRSRAGGIVVPAAPYDDVAAPAVHPRHGRSRPLQDRGTPGTLWLAAHR